MNKSPAHNTSNAPCFLLALVPALALISPRFCAFMPALIALVGLATYARRYAGIKGFLIYGAAPSYLRIIACISALITLLIGLSLTYTPFFTQSLDQAVKITGLLLGSVLCLLALAHMQHDQDAIKRTVDTASYILITVFIVMSMDYTLGLPLQEWMKTHLSKSDGFKPSEANRNIIAALFFGLPLSGYLLITGYYKRFALISALLVYVCFFTQSQSYCLGLLVAVISWGLVQISARLSVRITGIVVAALIMASPVFANYGLEYAPSWIHDYLSAAYPMMRLEIWYGTAQLIHDAPWLGHSINTFRLQDLPVPEMYLPKTRWLHPHNAALQIWYNFGMVGAVALAGTILAIYHATLKITDRRMRQLAYIMCNTGIAVASVSYGVWQGWWLGTLILSLCLFIAVGSSQKQQYQ